MKIQFYLLLSVLFLSVAAPGQNVGIGTIIPVEKLDINGNVKADTAKLNNLRITVNAGVGKVLTSDGLGNGSWQVSNIGIKAMNGLSKQQDSIRFGGRLLDSTRVYLSGKELLFSDNDGVTEMVMASVLTFGPNTTLSSTPVTQTFKALSDYLVVSVGLYVNSLPFAPVNLELKDNNGIVIASKVLSFTVITSGFQTWVFTQAVPIHAGLLYTISITGSGGTQLNYNASNPYPDGVSSLGANADIAFAVNVLDERAVLSIKNKRVGIGIADPQDILHVAGTLRVADGTQGEGKFFMSDVNGTGTWKGVSAAYFGGWATTGNSGTSAVNNFIGTIDNLPFNVRVNNQRSGGIDHSLYNAFWGYKAGSMNTTGTLNTAIGDSSLANNRTGSSNTAYGGYALSSNTTGGSNTAIGSGALNNNTTGNFNTAIGINSLVSNTTGNENIAVGLQSLILNDNGSNNIAMGSGALLRNSFGNNNIAIGTNAISQNTLGSNNIAIGVRSLNNNSIRSKLIAIGDSALFNNGTGAPGPVDAIQNIAIGTRALFANTLGSSNTAAGFKTLESNTTGSFNTAFGSQALLFNTTGSSNTANGHKALFSNTNGTDNTAVGDSALALNTEGTGNTGLGRGTLLNNTLGSLNTATGWKTLLSNTEGHSNTATGAYALVSSTAGFHNTAMGVESMSSSQTGSYNTAAGQYSMRSALNSSNNTALGYGALYSMTNADLNVAVGSFSGYYNVNGSHNTYVGYNSGPVSA